MSRYRRFTVQCAAAFTLMGSFAGRVGAQGPDSAVTPCTPFANARGGWSDVSHTVFGAYEAIQHPNGSTELCFLILWRGQAGWHEYRAAALEAAVRDEMIDSIAASNRSQRLTHWSGEMEHWEYLGDIEIEVQYNPTTRHLWIYGQDIDLTKDNVVLIDHVDRIGGLAGVTGTMRIDPTLPSLNVSFMALVERSQALTAFIR